MATTSDTDVDPPPRQALPHRFVEVLLIVLVFFIVAGDPPPHVNEPHYLCRLKHFWNPDWCAGDLFLESTDTQLVFIWTFGWVTRFLSLPATAWIGRLLAWTFLAWAWQRLSWRLIPRSLAAVLSAALFVALTSYAHLAGEWVVGGVEAKCFAYGFVLLALGDVIGLRWNRVLLWLGAATAFHPLVGGWSAVACGGIWLLSKGDILLFRPTRCMRRFSTAERKSRMSPFFFLCGGLLGAFGVVPALMLTWNVPADIVAETSRIYVFERLPHHLALLTLPGNEILLRLGRHAALLIALLVLSRATKNANQPTPPISRVVQFAWGAALLAAAGLIIEVALWNQPLVAGRLLRYYWFRLTDFAAPMAVALCATALIAAGLHRRRPWAAWGLTAALVLTGWHLSSVARLRALHPVPPADAKMRDYPAWVEACEWVADNTPPDALFLTPRLNHSFKWRTGRAEVATRKDIPQDAPSIVEWHRRIKDIYYTEIAGVEQPLDSLGILGSERVLELALRHGADFVLMDRGQLLSLPRAFWNEEYVVYRIESRSAGNSR